MTEKELVATLHESIFKANTDYENWSGGFWLCEYGVEGFMVSRIADAIMSSKNIQRHPTYLTLETSFQELLENQGKWPKGKRKECMKDGNRLDIALYYGEGLSQVLEVKRCWSPACLRDLERLCELLRHCGKNAGGTLKCGVFVLCLHAKAKKNQDVFECLERSCAEKEERCRNYLEKHGSVSSFYFSRGEVRLSEDQKAAFSSLCVIIK